MPGSILMEDDNISLGDVTWRPPMDEHIVVTP